MQVARNASVVIGLVLAVGGAVAGQTNAAEIQTQGEVIERHHDTQSQWVMDLAAATMLKPNPNPPHWPRPPYPRPPRPPFPPGPTFPTFPSLS